MVNLLEETLGFLAKNKLTKDDVCWIGDGNGYCDWDYFAANANFKYDGGFGAEFINRDLVVVGKDWWLERHEYDGSEWWEYKKLPEIPNKSQRNNVKIKAD